MMREVILSLLLTAQRVGQCRFWSASSVLTFIIVAPVVNGLTVTLTTGSTLRLHQPRFLFNQPLRRSSTNYPYHEKHFNSHKYKNSKFICWQRVQSTSIQSCSTDSNGSDQDEDSSKVIYYNDFDDDTLPAMTNEKDKSAGFSVWNQLKMRQRQLIMERIQHRKNIIKSGECTSEVAIAISNDWIRRISIHTYPYAILGTSTDHIYLANIETGKLWGTSKKSKRNSDWSQSILSHRLQYVAQQMFGMYDGGGTLAVAIYHTLLFEATRDGNWQCQYISLSQ